MIEIKLLLFGMSRPITLEIIDFKLTKTTLYLTPINEEQIEFDLDKVESLDFVRTIG